MHQRPERSRDHVPGTHCEALLEPWAPAWSTPAGHIRPMCSFTWPPPDIL